MESWAKKLESFLAKTLKDGVKDIENVDLAIITVWDPKLPLGRFSHFMNDQEDYYRALANINLSIFGRGTTLNERLLCFSARVGWKPVQIEITVNNDEDLLFKVDNNVARIILSTTTWEKFRIHNTRGFLELREQMIEQNLPPTEAGRTLEELYGSNLRRQRLCILDECLGIFADTDNKSDFFETLWYLTSDEDIRFYRKKQKFSEQEDISFKHLSPSVDFALVDEFLAFLQALSYYYSDSKNIIGVSKASKSPGRKYSRLPDFGASINIISTEHLKLPEGEGIRSKFERILTASSDKPSEILGKRKMKKISLGEPNSKFQMALNDPNFDSEHIKKQVEMFPNFYNLMIAMDLLSNTIHEGRDLLFTFLYGEGDVWRVTQNVLSEEEPEMYSKLPKAREFAHLMEHHWSIFQGERVAGFIDKTQANRVKLEGGIPLSKIIQLKPFSPLYSKLLKQSLGMLEEGIAVSTSGRGRVRIYYKHSNDNVQIIQWDTISNELELLSKDIGSIADTILKLSISGDFQHINRVKAVIEEAIEEVSDSLGEGAMIIVGEEDYIKNYLQDMDIDEAKMNWRVRNPLILLDKILLRTLLIMDGATWFVKNNNPIKSFVEPRFVVYPHCSQCNPSHAFSALDENCKAYATIPGPTRDSIKDNKRILNGKGSKHHGAANLSLLLFILNKCKPDNNKFRIFTVSADGPIKEWPHELLIERRET
jgi:hypothetical protein